MKKTLLCMCVVLIAVMVFCLAGCTRAAYTQEEMDQITQKGMEMMRAWLDENMPEAEIENCEALSLWSYDHAMYLTDYVRGNILHKGESIGFAIHTVTGQVYFNHQQQEFADAVRTYLCEVAGIPFETKENACGLTLGASVPIIFLLKICIYSVFSLFLQSFFAKKMIFDLQESKNAVY